MYVGDGQEVGTLRPRNISSGPGRKPGVVVVLKVYIDESGTHDGSPVVCVAAYMARPRQWTAFVKQWKLAIRSAKIYHATDAANCRGDFSLWTDEQVAAVVSIGTQKGL